MLEVKLKCNDCESHFFFISFFSKKGLYLTIWHSERISLTHLPLYSHTGLVVWPEITDTTRQPHCYFLAPRIQEPVTHQSNGSSTHTPTHITRKLNSKQKNLFAFSSKNFKCLTALQFIMHNENMS